MKKELISFSDIQLRLDKSDVEIDMRFVERLEDLYHDNPGTYRIATFPYVANRVKGCKVMEGIDIYELEYLSEVCPAQYNVFANGDDDTERQIFMTHGKYAHTVMLPRWDRKETKKILPFLHECKAIVVVNDSLSGSLSAEAVIEAFDHVESLRAFRYLKAAFETSMPPQNVYDALAVRGIKSLKPKTYVDQQNITRYEVTFVR